MYLRVKLQERTLRNLEVVSRRDYAAMRVTKGYVVSNLLCEYARYLNDTAALREAITESDMKQEGGAASVNLTITAAAEQHLYQLKQKLDAETGRSLFPAQVIDILLILAVREKAGESAAVFSDREVARKLMDLAYTLLTEDVLPVNVTNAKAGIIDVLQKNYLL